MDINTSDLLKARLSGDGLTMDISTLLIAADLVLRPQALFINSDDKAFLLEAMPDIEERFKIYESDVVRKGEIFLMDRKYIEKYNGEA